MNTVEALMSTVRMMTLIFIQRGVQRLRNSPKTAAMQPSTCILGMTLVLVSALYRRPTSHVKKLELANSAGRRSWPLGKMRQNSSVPVKPMIINQPYSRKLWSSLTKR